MKSARPKGQASFADHSGRNGSVQICLGSAEQLPDKRRGIVRDGVAAPSGVLIGARQNELWSLGGRASKTSTVLNGTPLLRIASVNGATATSES